MDQIVEEEGDAVEYDGGPPIDASSNDTNGIKDNDVNDDKDIRRDQEELEDDRRHHHRRDDDRHTLTNDKELRRTPISTPNDAPGRNIPHQRRRPLQNNNPSPPYYEYDNYDREGRTPQHPPSHNLHYQQLNDAQFPPHQSSWQSPDASSSSALSSVAGGFSLGVISLAAWRWLNGGDFVLCPPPDLTMMRKNKGVADYEDADFTSRLVQEEDEEEDDDGEEVDVDDDDEEEEEEDGEEDDDVDDAVRMILNGTCDNLQLPQPRRQEHTELISEMRSLTSAIHSHREVLDRATRAAFTASGVGKGMTDDAMDFLKQKKKKEAENNNDGGNKNKVGAEESIDDGNNDKVDEKLIAVAALLKDVSSELLELKQSISNQPLSKKNHMGGEIEDEDGDFIGDVVNVEKNRDNEVEESCGDKQDPVDMIDLVMDKILRILNVVEPTQLNGEDKHDEKDGTSVEVVDKETIKKDASIQIEHDQTQSIDSAIENVSLSPPSVLITQISELQEIQQKNDGSDINGDHDIIAIEREATIESTLSMETSAPVPPIPDPTAKSGIETSNKNLEDALRMLATSNNANDVKVGAQMLYLYCRNIAKNPTVPRYRKLYTNNDNYRNKVGNLVGVTEFLVAVGFIERPGNNMFEWSSTDDDTAVDGTRSKLDFALVALEMMKNGTADGGMIGPNI